MLPTVVDDPSAAAAAAVGAAASSSFPDADVYGNGDSDDIDFPSDPNHATTQAFSSAAAAAAAAGPGGGGGAGSGSGGERRPLFQRLWTEEDEIVILRAFAEFTAQRGTAFASHQYDTDPFYEDMRRRLQLDFSKSQLVEKLRRLKRKYRNCVDRLRATGQSFSFRSPHEQAIFEIARGIWRPTSDKHGRDADSDDDALPDAAAAVAVPAPANGEVRFPSSTRAQQRRGRRRRTAAAARRHRHRRRCIRAAAALPTGSRAGARQGGGRAPALLPAGRGGHRHRARPRRGSRLGGGVGGGERGGRHPGAAVQGDGARHAHRRDGAAVAGAAGAGDPDERGEVEAAADPGAGGVPPAHRPAAGPGEDGAGGAQVHAAGDAVTSAPHSTLSLSLTGKEDEGVCFADRISRRGWDSRGIIMIIPCVILIQVAKYSSVSLTFSASFT
uniref:Glabrous enhancer-binding protein-like DBD domain-containing protein n=1 Tax=Oryza glaberrima TaxID=4538 RepID=I1PBM8_ORYGL